MTTKVVKGSIWTLAGSVVPLAVTFVSTPFIIRFLGAESYGVLLLVGLIPTYFSFADFGMGVASTKFASEVYGQGDRVKEGEIVRSTAAIAFVSSLVVAIPLFLFSQPIIIALNVPEHLHAEASVALKIASASFVLGILSSVLNAPMLARLRMDLNTVTSAFPRIMLAAVTPFIIYYGGGIVGAISWAFIVNLTALAVILYLSGRLLPELFRTSVDREYFRRVIKFGGSWFVAMIAAMLLINLEKLFLTKMVSVKALAYYSVAFTFANMATMFSQAMSQSLVPAFSQLLVPGKRSEFDALFARSIRLTLIWLLPAVMLLFVIAKPFFTIWAGEDFGVNSTLPFYVLLVGLLFNLQATVPYTAIAAVGRTDVFARLYWVELLLYAVGAYVLISNFGIVGAAIAWTLRVLFDAFLMIRLSKKYAGVDFRHLDNVKKIFLAAIALLPAGFAAALNSYSLWLIALVPMGLAAYSAVVWRMGVDADEKRWLIGKYRNWRN